MTPPPEVTELVNAIWIELSTATVKYPPMASAHEGYAVLLEEVDELWHEVKCRPAARSRARMRAEAIQVAAMAIRFVLDVCKKEESP